MPQLDTVIIFSGQHERLAVFYQEGLGLPAAQPYGEDHLGIQLENMYLGFDRETDAPAPKPPAVSLWFGVADLDGTYARLLELGAVSRYPPQVKPFGERIASIYDLDGNVLGLVERPPEGRGREP